MDNIHFIRPLWLLALPLVLLIVFLLQRYQGRVSDWRKAMDSQLLDAMTASMPRRRRWWLDLLIAGLVFAIIALSGPSLGNSERQVFRKTNARLILFDISKSMDARDVAPTRLIRARTVAGHILDASANYRTGIISYAGGAWVLAPLTRDGRTLKEMLRVLETSIAPAQGSRPDLALRRAAELLTRADAKNAEIILFSDGFRAEHARRVASDLRQRGHRISILATGTADGAPIPLRTGGEMRDFNDERVIARTDMTKLKTLAEAGGGTVLKIGDATSGLIGWLDGMRIEQDDEDTADLDDTIITYRDDGPWLLLPLLFLAALAFRRGWLMVLPLALFLSPPPVRADWTDLWFRDDQQTAAAIDRGDFETAIDKAPDRQWLATALYRSGQYAMAATVFAEDGTPDAFYNSANALAMSGNFEAALGAYDEALALNPEHEDALFNREIVQQLVEQQQNDGPGNQAASNFDDSDGTGSETDASTDAQMDLNQTETPRSVTTCWPMARRSKRSGRTRTTPVNRRSSPSTPKKRK